MVTHSRTRAEEIMRARGLSQAEIARRGNWHSSNVSRFMAGRVGLSGVNRRRLALILQCPESALVEPIGSPVPPPNPAPYPPLTASEAFDDRLGALADLLGVNDPRAFLPFLLNGAYGELPDQVAERVREALEAREAARRGPAQAKRRKR